MSKMTRSYSLDPAVATWLDRQPDGRGKKRSRSQLVSEAVFYYWMTDRDDTIQQNRNLRLINSRYLEELRELRAKRGLLHRLMRLLRKRE
jgi:hypothetical protein